MPYQNWDYWGHRLFVTWAYIATARIPSAEVERLEGGMAEFCSFPFNILEFPSFTGSCWYWVEVCKDKALDELLWWRWHLATSFQHHPQPQVISIPWPLVQQHLLPQERPWWPTEKAQLEKLHSKPFQIVSFGMLPNLNIVTLEPTDAWGFVKQELWCYFPVLIFGNTFRREGGVGESADVTSLSIFNSRNAMLTAWYRISIIR